MKNMRILSCVLLTLCFSLALAAAPKKTVPIKTAYVPAYSSIYHGDNNKQINLAITLSIRNTDAAHNITVTGVDYYDEKGKLVKKYLESPATLLPRETQLFTVKESDTAGGTGAHFIVQWSAPEKTNAPIIESIMISTAMQQGISFTSRGVEIK